MAATFHPVIRLLLGTRFSGRLSHLVLFLGCNAGCPVCLTQDCLLGKLCHHHQLDLSSHEPINLLTLQQLCLVVNGATFTAAAGDSSFRPSAAPLLSGDLQTPSPLV